MLQEALSYFPLAELDDLRKISKDLQSSCNTRKTFIRSLLRKGRKVEIVGLASEKGKFLNGRIGIIGCEMSTTTGTGRLPVNILHLTGTSQHLAVKPQNMNPFLPAKVEQAEDRRQRDIRYSSDGKVREGHGRFLDQVLMLNRSAVNDITCDCDIHDFNEFMNLPRGHPVIAKLNFQVYTMYKVLPRMAGYQTGKSGNVSILDKTVMSLVDNEQMSIDYFGKMGKWEMDGRNGEWIVRNMVNFMKTWDDERIYGQFWVYKIVPSGTLLVKVEDPEQSTDEGGLGDVYLVKGLGSQVGEQLHSLPAIISTTFLPVYNFLVYDSIMTTDQIPASRAKSARIAAHVEKALSDQTVVTCGKSAALGLWDGPPPALPKIPRKGEDLQPLDWDNYGASGDDNANGNDDTNQKEKKSSTTNFTPTRQQKDIAEAIAKYAKKIGFKTIDKATLGPNLSPPVMVVRRLAYTKSENPNQMCGVSFNNMPIDFFRFEKWPTYTLDELLPQVARIVKQRKAVPCLIWMDEISLVEPLQGLIKAAFHSIGFNEEMEVQWYPPPSAEEQGYHQTLGPGATRPF